MKFGVVPDLVPDVPVLLASSSWIISSSDFSLVPDFISIGSDFLVSLSDDPDISRGTPEGPKIDSKSLVADP